MNLLSRRSVLAIAAVVVDVALHSARAAPVVAKALKTARVTNCPDATWRRCSRGLVHAKILKGVRPGREAAIAELARERQRISVGEIVRTSRCRLSTADPDDLRVKLGAARAGDRSGRAQVRAETASRQSRCDHGRTDVRGRPRRRMFSTTRRSAAISVS